MADTTKLLPREAKVPALTDDSSFDAAEVSHARYLVVNYSDYFKLGSNPGSAMHTEDASKQGYSRAGLIAAEQSDLYDACGKLISQSAAVDGWMEGAFHRLSLLSPTNRLAAYGSYKEPGGCWVAGLRLKSGNSVTRAAAIEFPGDGSEISLTTLVEGEWPNVLSSCPGYTFPAGLPITIQFGYGVAPAVIDTSLTLNGQAVEHCLVEANSYENPDPGAGEWGRVTLKGFGAIILVPRSPLAVGSYVVQIGTNQTRYEWSFRVS